MSPPLPTITSKQIIRALKRAGFVFKPQSGSHQIFIHLDRPGNIVVVPFHNRDLKKGTLKSILRQAGLSVEDLIRLLS